MPGTQTHAETARLLSLLWGDDEYNPIMPNDADGWKYLGKGWSRHALLGPDGVVYKVPTQRRGADRVSVSEVENAKRLRGTGGGTKWETPEADLFTVDGTPIVAMEFIPEPLNEVDFADFRWLERNWGLMDMHHGNVAKRGDVWYVIDLGEDAEEVSFSSSIS